MFNIPLPCTNPQNYDLYLKKIIIIATKHLQKKDFNIDIFLILFQHVTRPSQD